MWTASYRVTAPLLMSMMLLAGTAPAAARGGSPASPPAPLHGRVDAALRRARTYLEGEQGTNGAWRWSSKGRRNGANWPAAACDGGLTCLVLIALKECGAGLDAEAIKRALKHLHSGFGSGSKPDGATTYLGTTYGASSYLWMLSELRPPGHQVQASRAAIAISKAQTSDGLWSYRVPTVLIQAGYAKSARAFTPGPHGDISNAQFAVLGLAAAEALGVYRGRTPWIRLRAALLKHANRDGGFGYSFDPKGISAFRASYFSGTAIGATMLLLALQRTGLSEEKALRERKVSRALRWLKKRAPYDRRTRKLDFRRSSDGVSQPGFYEMLALERLGTLSKLTELGGFRWYDACAEYLLALQQPDGGWPAGSHWHAGFAHKNRTEMTTFAVLILGRASHRISGSTSPVTPQHVRDSRTIPEPVFSRLILDSVRHLAREYDSVARETWRAAFIAAGSRSWLALAKLVGTASKPVGEASHALLVSITGARDAPTVAGREERQLYWERLIEGLSRK